MYVMYVGMYLCMHADCCYLEDPLRKKLRYCYNFSKFAIFVNMIVGDMIKDITVGLLGARNANYRGCPNRFDWFDRLHCFTVLNNHEHSIEQQQIN
jgi:hypothetical protein